MNTSMPSPLAFARVSPRRPIDLRASSLKLTPFSHLHVLVSASHHLCLSRLPHVVRTLSQPSYTPIAALTSTIYFSHSGALATTSLYSFLRHPSLRSTALLVAGTSGAGLFYAGAKGTTNGLEDGPWIGVGELSSSPPFIIAST